jgi:hypothetical protein
VLKEDQSSASLDLGRGRQVRQSGQVIQEACHFRGSQLWRVLEVMKVDVAPHPINLGLAKGQDLTARAQRVGEAVEQFR